MTSLTPPTFIDTNIENIVNELVQRYLELSGKDKLYDGQLERLLIDLMAYKESLARLRVKESCKENLVEYARGDVLTALGWLVDIKRDDGESDNELRQRIKQERGYTTTGPLAAYNHAVSELNRSLKLKKEFIENFEDGENIIEDISLEHYNGTSDQPMAHTRIYHLLSNKRNKKGEKYITEVLKNEIEADLLTNLRNSKTRPLTEYVDVQAAKEIKVKIPISIYLYADAERVLVKQQIEQVKAAYQNLMEKTVGKDLVASEIIGKFNAIPGVYNVTVTDKDMKFSDDSTDFETYQNNKTEGFSARVQKIGQDIIVKPEYYFLCEINYGDLGVAHSRMFSIEQEV